MTEKSARRLLLGVSTTASLLLLEATVRLLFGAPLLTLRDLREARIIIDQRQIADQGSSSMYDPLLGWVTKPAISSLGGDFHTIDDGIRKNAKDEGPRPLSEGGILAVGDSFTAGAEIDDEETWPAHLERTLGRPVFNAGVGGYGSDQIVLNAERLLPILKPSVLLIGFLVPDDVQRAGYSIWARPKPYFVREGGRFVQKNDPVPTSREKLSEDSLGKRIMSRSMTLNVVFERLRPEWWLSEINGQRHERIGNNPSAVTCYLIDRLQDTLAASAIRGVVVIQHGGWIFARNQPRSFEADTLIRCAREAGYEIVDEYDSLNAVARRSPEELKLHYMMHDSGQTYGHMSSKGNENLARLIAEQSRLPAPPPRLRGDPARIARVPGDGINRLAGVAFEHLQRANASVTSVSDTGPITSEPVFQILPTTERAEHYVSIGWSADQPGPFTFSVYVRAQDEADIRLQLLDSKTNGAIVDFDVASGVFDIYRVGGGSDLDFATEPAGPGWLRLSLTARVLESSGGVIFQLAQGPADTNFAGGPGQLLQAPMVERGEAASRFCRPGDCAGVNQPRGETTHVPRTPGDGINRLVGVEVSHLQRANTVVAASAEAAPIMGEPVLHIAATAELAEHYASIGWSGQQPGLYTFSVYVRERREGSIRLQLLDSKVNGAVADFTYTSRRFDIHKIGSAAEVNFSVEPLGEGWVRLLLTAQLLAPSGSVIVQLRDTGGSTNFAGVKTNPPAEAIHAPMIELGGAASPFCRPGACPASTNR